MKKPKEVSFNAFKSQYSKSVKKKKTFIKWTLKTNEDLSKNVLFSKVKNLILNVSLLWFFSSFKKIYNT